MIRYTLSCDNDHRFEAWFSGSHAFEEQRSAGHVSCPACGSANVEKALMTPSVASGRKKSGRSNIAAAGSGRKADPGVQVPVASNKALPEEFMKMMRTIRDSVKENAEYVGPKFAEEARKIHYGESKERGIYGEASSEDVSGLKEEGIDVMPLPVLPEDRN